MKRIDVSENPIAFTNQLVNAFGPQRFFTGDENPIPPNPEDETGALATFGVAALSSIAGLSFMVIFTYIAAFVMLTLGLMLLMRFLWLTFLLVLSPLIWLFWVIPALEGKFSHWWNKFLQWVFFAPAVTFFMYLSIVAIEFMGAQKATLLKSAGEFGGFFSSLMQGVMIQGVQMIVISGFMISGIIVAQSMSITGAQGALDLAKKARKGVQTWAGKKAVQTATRPLRGETGRKVTEWMQNTPVLRTAGTFLARQRLAFEKKASDEAKKKLPTDLREQALQYGSLTTTNAGRVQIMDNLAKERKMRKRKLDLEQRKMDEKDAHIQDLEVQREETRKRGDVDTTNKLSVEIDAEIKTRNELTKVGSDYQKTQEAMREIDEATQNLPKNAREGLESAGYEVKSTKLGGLYGKKGAVSPTEGSFEKFKNLAKEVSKEEGGEKKEKESKEEKKEEKKT
jgi:hypothetical protein